MIRALTNDIGALYIFVDRTTVDVIDDMEEGGRKQEKKLEIFSFVAGKEEDDWW